MNLVTRTNYSIVFRHLECHDIGATFRNITIPVVDHLVTWKVACAASQNMLTCMDIPLGLDCNSHWQSTTCCTTMVSISLHVYLLMTWVLWYKKHSIPSYDFCSVKSVPMSLTSMSSSTLLGATKTANMTTTMELSRSLSHQHATVLTQTKFILAQLHKYWNMNQ